MQSRTPIAERAANPTSLVSHCLLIKEMQQLKLHRGSETEKSARILVLEPYNWFICEIQAFWQRVLQKSLTCTYAGTTRKN